MTPADIVKILGAAAPIAVTVASMANKSEVAERKEPTNNITNNVSIVVNNHFYTNSERDALCIASKIQNEMIGTISSGTRYML